MLVETWRGGRRAWDRLSARERRLLAGLALVALAFLPLRMADRAQAAQERLTAAAAELELARAAAPGATGADLARQLTDERRRVATWSWDAPSPTVGPLLLERKVTNIAGRAGLAEAEVAADRDLAEVGGVSFVRLEVRARFDRAALAGFAAGLEATGKGFLVESLAVEEQPEGPYLLMALRLPLRFGQAAQ